MEQRSEYHRCYSHGILLSLLAGFPFWYVVESIGQAFGIEKLANYGAYFALPFAGDKFQGIKLGAATALAFVILTGILYHLANSAIGASTNDAILVQPMFIFAAFRTAILPLAICTQLFSWIGDLTGLEKMTQYKVFAIVGLVVGVATYIILRKKGDVFD